MPATIAPARPPVPTTSAASATATTRLTQKPGSLNSLVTNSNADLSASHAAFAALLTLPQRLLSSLGFLLASELTLAWPCEILPPVSPGIFAVPLWTFVAVASSLVLAPVSPVVNLPLTLVALALTLVPNWVTVLSPEDVADLAVLLTWVLTPVATFAAPLAAPLAVWEAVPDAERAWPATLVLAPFAAVAAPCVACLAILPPPVIPAEEIFFSARLISPPASGASSLRIAARLTIRLSWRASAWSAFVTAACCVRTDRWAALPAWAMPDLALETAWLMPCCAPAWPADSALFAPLCTWPSDLLPADTP
jgi:hypothetical protein